MVVLRLDPTTLRRRAETRVLTPIRFVLSFVSFVLFVPFHYRPVSRFSKMSSTIFPTDYCLPSTVYRPGLPCSALRMSYKTDKPRANTLTALTPRQRSLKTSWQPALSTRPRSPALACRTRHPWPVSCSPPKQWPPRSPKKRAKPAACPAARAAWEWECNQIGGRPKRNADTLVRNAAPRRPMSETHIHQKQKASQKCGAFLICQIHHAREFNPALNGRCRDIPPLSGSAGAHSPPDHRDYRRRCRADRSG